MMASYGDTKSLAAMAPWNNQTRPWPGLTLRDLLGKVDQFSSPHFFGGEDSKAGLKGGEGGWGVAQPSAFLGPQIWEKKLSMSAMEEEGGWNDYSPSNRYQQSQGPIHSPAALQQRQPLPKVDSYQSYHQQAFPGLIPHQYHETQQQLAQEFARHAGSANTAGFEVSDSDLALATVPGIDFDPKKRVFSAEELKPHATIRKRPKRVTPDEKKDNRYWDKRGKNNVAARRSREARRLKENQIALRAAYLENQNIQLRLTLKSLNSENANIKVSVEVLMSRIKKKEEDMKARRASMEQAK